MSDRRVMYRWRPCWRPRRRAAGDPGVVVKGVTDVWVKLSRCCTPVPGDDIIGFVTRGRGVSVHRADCPNASALRAEAERWLQAQGAVSRAFLELASDRKRLRLHARIGLGFLAEP